MNERMDRAMAACRDRLERAYARGRRRLAAWRDDLSGATLVQFIIVLPVFLLIIMGLYGLFTVMAARDTLCESAWEASRYLQVEGPFFPDNDPAYNYPEGWKLVAVDIMNQELASRWLNTDTQLYPVLAADVEISPQSIRRSPEDTVEVRDDPQGAVENSWFTIHVRKTISNPLGTLLGADPGLGTLNLSCKSVGFFEGPPLGPTDSDTGGGPNRCEPPLLPCGPCPGCTPTTVGRNTPTICPTCRN